MVRVAVEDFEVADSLSAEERTGYRSVESKVGLVNEIARLGYGRDNQLTSTFLLGEVSDAVEWEESECIPSELKTPVPSNDW